VVTLFCVACEDNVAQFGSRANEQRTLAASAAPSATAAPAKPEDPLAGLVVDDLGPFLQSERIDMAAKDAAERLRSVVWKLPVKQKVVPVSATRSAKAQHVAALVHALGQAGAAQVDVKTPVRTEATMAVLKLIPEQLAAASVPDCAVVGLIKKDNSTAVWHVRGGTALKFTKGLAGPDISATVVGLQDQMKIKTCPALHWLLTGEENVMWGFVFDLGMAVATTSPPPRAANAVLLREAPVAGRAVVLAK